MKRAGHYVVKLSQRRVTLKNRDPNELWWGIDEHPSSNAEEVYVVSSLRIDLGAKPVFVPRSFFADLGEVNKMSVRVISNGCAIRIVGSDAGYGYKAEIRVKKDLAVERWVRSGEFPDEVWQHDVFHSQFEPGM
ncbi:MAG: hypothetical protein HYR64_00465 [Fimbriimonas ginsengisoli]|uniref:Uncharacterized protein n=1 Tax=Fimbriimonas ginsengisoli TaxID=1005039 RepID=A0A931PSR0_FIMGI|nr:hypothetical protein [Fimbriimonas ginsengisoli]